MKKPLIAGSALIFAGLLLLGPLPDCCGQRLGLGLGPGGEPLPAGAPGSDPANETIQAILSAQVDAVLRPGGAPVWTSLNFYLEKLLVEAEPQLLTSVSQPALVTEPGAPAARDPDATFREALDNVWGLGAAGLEKIQEDMAKAGSAAERKAVFERYVGRLESALDGAMAAYQQNPTEENRKNAQDSLDEYYQTRMALAEDRQERNRLQGEYDKLDRELAQ